jgi:glutaredoxin
MRVIIYTKRNCVYCDYTKNLLEKNNISYDNLILDEDFTKEHLMELFPSSKTFPVIVVDGFNIGGYDALKLIFEQKTETRKLLNEGN